MKIYIDLLLFINFFFDGVILLMTNFILKRRVKLEKIILGAFFGSFSILLLFISFNNLQLFLYKVIISIIMIMITFSYKNLKTFLTNMIFLYINSIFIGGVLYFIDNMFAYKKVGLIFVNNGYSINLIVIIIITPFIAYFYIKQNRKLKLKYNSYYKVDIVLKGITLNCTGFMDTGNTLVDYNTKKIVILIDKRKIIFPIKTYIKVSYFNASGESYINCIEVEKIIINEIEYKNVLLGIMPDDVKLNDYDVILNYKLMEGNEI